VFRSLIWPRLYIITELSRVALCALVLSMISCESATQGISRAAQSITNLAQSSTDTAEGIRDDADARGDDTTSDAADSIIDDQEEIIGNADGVLDRIPMVEDTVPWWASMIQRGSTALIAIGIIATFWYLGLGSIVKRIVWSMGLFIPGRAMRAAAIDLKHYESDNPVTMREGVAVRRSSDPAYEAARKLIKKRNGT